MKKVRPPFSLLWPADLGGGYRGGVGYVVDEAHPLEAKWLRGQEHKLEFAPDDAKPGKITEPSALAALRKFEEGPKPKPEPVKAVRKKRASKRTKPAVDIPAPEKQEDRDE